MLNHQHHSAETEDILHVLAERQREARHHVLRTGPAFYEHLRPSGVCIRVLRHGALSPEQRDALGTFRLDQYGLHGLYRPEIIVERDLRVDPMLDRLEASALHLLALGAQDELLTYTCLQGPSAVAPHALTNGAVPRLRDSERPIFPTETRFGMSLFPSLPALADLPITAVVEVSRLVRNSVVRAPEARFATFDLAYVLTRLLINPELGLSATIGRMMREARRLFYELRMPMLYAPDAPLLVHDTIPGEDFWTPSSQAPGAFWPYAAATADVRAIEPYLVRLNQALDAPLEHILPQMKEILSTTAPNPPTSLLREAARSPLRWTADATTR
ncbi:MAG TPA: hypothetical protein VF807_14150 [Ktedonobacterales bacterium]